HKDKNVFMYIKYMFNSVLCDVLKLVFNEKVKINTNN
ncbi:hypothetical protein A5798_002823, partial [Enterococcus sp. 6C8_DIV0013]